ncbi:MAG: tetratricopeptide repeat protein, partial [Proteobacteria bacterium]
MSIDREKVQQAAQKYVEKKRYDKAIVEYSRLVQADPNDARTLLKIGDLQSKSGAFPDAIATYDRVGNLYAAQGFALKAIAVYKQIRELVARHAPQLDERYAYITPKLADLYKQLGLVSDAVSALDEVATKLQARNKHVEAIEVFQKIVELDPTNPLPHLRLAEAFSRAQNVDGAVKEFGVAAKQLISLGRRDDAIKVLERSLHHRADPEQARIAAEYYVDKGTQQDGLRALSKLQTCFQADPRDLDTLHLLSRAFTLIGQQQKSIEVQKEMGRIARDAGDLPKFQQIVDSLMQLAPNDEVVRRLRGQADTAREN